MGRYARICLAIAAGVAAMTATRPALAQAAPNPPAEWFVYAVVIGVIVLGVVAILLVRAAVMNTSWSLTDALAEETEVTLMKRDATTGEATVALDAAGKPVMVTEMKASVSRLIALMGMIVILVMFIGFGSIAMFKFAMSDAMPTGIDDVINFLVAGMTLFAPYVVNKFASLFDGLTASKPR